MIKQKSLLVGIALIYLLAAACTKKQAEEFKPETPDHPETNVSYAATIGPLFQTKCAGCHSGSGRGTTAWLFTGYSSVRNDADRIRNAVVVTRAMPMGGSLSAAELESVRKWFDQGMQP